MMTYNLAFIALAFVDFTLPSMAGV